MEKKRINWFLFVLVIIFLLGVVVSTVILLKPQFKEKFTVTFYDVNGDKLSQQRIKDGAPAYFKGEIQLYPQKVFKGWNQDINEIKANTEVLPIYQDISENNNVFYIDSIYADKNEKIVVDLKVGGGISLNSAEIGIAYDPNIISLVDVKKEKNCSDFKKKKDGYLILNLNFDQFNSGDTVAHIELKAKNINSVRTDLPIDLINLEYNGGTQQSESISGLIYIY